LLNKERCEVANIVYKKILKQYSNDLTSLQDILYNDFNEYLFNDYFVLCNMIKFELISDI